MDGDDRVDRWEVGSEFHWNPQDHCPPQVDSDRWLHSTHTRYATATGALIRILQHLGTRPNLYLPSFFCMEVAAALAPHAAIHWYAASGFSPSRTAPPPSPGAEDVILVQNLFGRAVRDEWTQWIPNRTDIVLIEDHTHDPISEWALTSSATYCVASLRKTLPLPDGAILWSPVGRDVPGPTAGISDGAHLKLAGMVLKDAWLRGAPVRKQQFRDLQVRGETLLSGSTARMTPVAEVALDLLDPWDLRRVRTANAQLLTSLITLDRPSPVVLLRGADPAGAPFHVQVLCDSRRARDALATHLRERRIYATVHWRQPAAGVTSGDPEAVDLANRILTVPVDHRYQEHDMELVAQAFHEFGHRRTSRNP